MSALEAAARRVLCARDRPYGRAGPWSDGFARIFGIFVFTTCCLGVLRAQEYYVAIDGDDTASGISLESPWRHCAHAANLAVAGDTVYVKAGNYGNELLVFPSDGDADHPITFTGYHTIPGDAAPVGRANAVGFPRADLPLLDGGNATVGTAISLINRRYVTVSNFQLRNYEIGVDAYGAVNVHLENLAGAMFGDVDAGYDGVGIKFGSGSTGNVMSNCSIFNACAEALSVVGNGNRLIDCHAACDNNTTGVNSATDYYLIVAGNDNVIERCEVERIGNLGHLGHGISLKTDCTRNQVIDCLAINMSEGFCARHRGAVGNHFERCRAVSRGSGSFGFVARDGASDNTFTGCQANSCYAAVAFYDTSEDDGAQFAGRRNIFTNCTFADSEAAAIDFDRYDQASIAEDNAFVNCTFTGGPALFLAGRANNNTTFLNCIITGFTSYQSETFAVDASMNFCNVWDCGFTALAGNGNIAADPLFFAPSLGDYHLRSASGRWSPVDQAWARDGETSLCIDAGDPGSAFALEPLGNGGRINQGADGNTTYASRTALTPSLADIRASFGTRTGDAAFSLEADVNGDGRVDAEDMAFLLSSFGP